MSTDTIEKARIQRNDGDPHPKNPNLVWSSSAAGGKGDWRVKKKTDGGKTPAPAAKKNDDTSNGSNNGGSQNPKQPAKPSDSFAGMSHDELVAYAKQIASPKLVAIVNNTDLDRKARVVAFSELKTRDDFDESAITVDDIQHSVPKKAKIQYKTKKPNIEITVPDTFQLKSRKTGKLQTVNTSERRKSYEKLPDDRLLNILNDKKMNPLVRQIAYEEALARGIDEDKVDVSGTLSDHWKAVEDRQNKLNKHSNNAEDDEDEGEYYDTENPMNFNPEQAEEIMKEFPEGDLGWMDKNDTRIQSAFNKFRTLTDRKAYDRFLDYQKRKMPDYQKPSEVIEDLNTDYLSFMVTDSSPLFISAGGAGAGKTYGFKKIAEELNIPPLGEGENPDDADWGYVRLTNPKSEKEFLQMLKRYNGTYFDTTDGEEHGHILLFDDNDDILRKREFQAIMKNLADGDPDARTFKDPDTGQMIKFTGKIMVITNKTMDSLSDDEDKKAILSRAEKSDIHFTVNENIEILRQRYKTMSVDGLKLPKGKEDQIREDVFNFIVDNADRLDPDKFTVRKFAEVLKAIQKNALRDMYSQRSSTIASLTGVGGKSWQTLALKTLNKADDDELNDKKKKEDKRNNPAVKKRMEMIKKKNPKLYAELWGDKALDILNRDDDEDKAEKALFNDMSLDEAENLLFG